MTIIKTFLFNNKQFLSVTRSALDFLTAKNHTMHLMLAQVGGLKNIKELCVKKCTYDNKVIQMMEQLYRLVRVSIFFRRVANDKTFVHFLFIFYYYHTYYST